MADIYCPLCDHGYDSGDYPDHWMEARDNRFVFECGECGLEFEVYIELVPEFYSVREGSRLTRWQDPIC